jgi:hypothetical protein
MPSPLKRIERSVTVAGRKFSTSFECPCEPNQQHLFEWDGKDAFGRVVVGKLPVTVDIGYVYDGAYLRSQCSRPLIGFRPLVQYEDPLSNWVQRRDRGDISAGYCRV